jgi:hypothetical protein
VKPSKGPMYNPVMWPGAGRTNAGSNMFMAPGCDAVGGGSVFLSSADAAAIGGGAGSGATEPLTARQHRRPPSPVLMPRSARPSVGVGAHGAVVAGAGITPLTTRSTAGAGGLSLAAGAAMAGGRPVTPRYRRLSSPGPRAATTRGIA